MSRITRKSARNTRLVKIRRYHRDHLLVDRSRITRQVTVSVGTGTADEIVAALRKAGTSTMDRSELTLSIGFRRDKFYQGGPNELTISTRQVRKVTYVAELILKKTDVAVMCAWMLKEYGDQVFGLMFVRDRAMGESRKRGDQSMTEPEP